jgi:hypothetical protein
MNSFRTATYLFAISNGLFLFSLSSCRSVIAKEVSEPKKVIRESVGLLKDLVLFRTSHYIPQKGSATKFNLFYNLMMVGFWSLVISIILIGYFAPIRTMN